MAEVQTLSVVSSGAARWSLWARFPSRGTLRMIAAMGLGGCNTKRSPLAATSHTRSAPT